MWRIWWWNGMSRMKQRGIGTGIVRARSVNMQYTDMKVVCWTYEDIWSIVAYGPGAYEWNSDDLKKKNCRRLRWSAQNAARPWRYVSLKTLWTSGADSETGGRRRKCAEKQNTSGITLGSCKVQWLLERSTGWRNILRVVGWDADLPRSDDWSCGMVVWRS